MTIRMMDIGWAAGFLEGEGSFSLLGGNNPRITAVQVELDPLEKLVELFGGKIYPKKIAGFGKQPVSYWYVGGGHSVGIMMMLFPLMSGKRQRQISKAVSAWKIKGAKGGALHYRSVATDADALTIMQRIKNGESMLSLEKELGISHTTMSMWMRGTKRPYLRLTLDGNDAPPPLPRNRGASHRLSNYTDEEVLVKMRQIRAGEVTIYRAAKDLELSYHAVYDWVLGKNRPYLLAQVLREETEALEEV